MQRVKTLVFDGPQLLAVVFLVATLPPAAIAILGRFDGLYGQDPFAYLDYAIGPLRQSLVRLTLPPPFYWPPGYPLLVTLVFFAIKPAALAGQLTSLVAGGLVPVFTVLLARAVLSPDRAPSNGATPCRSGRRERWTGSLAVVPALAGLLVAFAGQLWQSSIVVMSDTTGLAFATAGVWAVARYGRSGKVGWLLAGGAALALAVATRWAYALVAIPVAAYTVLTLIHRDRRTAVPHFAGVGLVVAIILAPLLGSAFQSILSAGAGAIPFGTDLQVYTWGPLNALRHEFLTADGNLDYRLPNGLYYLVAPGRPYFFTPLLAWLILPGLGRVVRRREATPLLLIVGWAAIVYVFHAGAPWQNFRFTLAFLPPLAILAAVGAVEVGHFLTARARMAFALLLVAGFVWMAFAGASLTRDFIDRKDADLATARWVSGTLPPRARLLAFGLTLTLRHYTTVETLDLSDLNDHDVDRLLSASRPVYLLLNVDNVDAQWKGRAPAEIYHYLRDGPGLRPIGRRGASTLFQVATSAPTLTPAASQSRDGSDSPLSAARPVERVEPR